MIDAGTNLSLVRYPAAPAAAAADWQQREAGGGAVSMGTAAAHTAGIMSRGRMAQETGDDDKYKWAEQHKKGRCVSGNVFRHLVRADDRFVCSLYIKLLPLLFCLFVNPHPPPPPTHSSLFNLSEE